MIANVYGRFTPARLPVLPSAVQRSVVLVPPAQGGKAVRMSGQHGATPCHTHKTSDCQNHVTSETFLSCRISD